MLEYENPKTGTIVKREAPNDETTTYAGKSMIIETDNEGFITYANKRFVETSGYDKEELIGLPHCMHMHPEMPKMIFKDACEMTSQGRTWSGYIKNISKDGTSYWTETSIQPKLCEKNTVIGFMAIRRAPDSVELQNVIEEYEKLKDNTLDVKTSQYCGEVYMGRGACNF